MHFLLSKTSQYTLQHTPTHRLSRPLTMLLYPPSHHRLSVQLDEPSRPPNKPDMYASGSNFFGTHNGKHPLITHPVNIRLHTHTPSIN